MTRPVAPTISNPTANNGGTPNTTLAKHVANNMHKATDDLINGWKEIRKAKKAYDLAEQYYVGNRPEFFASIRYRIALQRTGTTYRMNFAKTPVDAVVDRLEIHGIVAGDDATTNILKQVLDANQFDIEAPEVHRRAGEFGDAYLLIWPDTGDEPEPDTDDEPNNPTDTEPEAEETEDIDDDSPTDIVGGQVIDMYYNDPRTMRVFYDEENPRRKKYAVKLWKYGTEGQQRINLYYKDRIEKWVTQAGRKGDQAIDWIHFDDGTGEWPTPNPYNRIPVFHFRNDRPYGQPEHINAYGAQDAITKIIITHMTTMDYHGFPQRYAIQGGDLDDDDAMEDFDFEDGDPEEDDEGAVQKRATVTARPGELWLLKNVKGVGQFDAAKADVFLGPLDTYVRSMAQLTTTPYHYFDPSGNVPSGESLRVADAPMVKKVQHRQINFGATWCEAAEFILLLLGNKNAAGTVNVNWASPVTYDDLLVWDLAQYKRDTGVPIRQILGEAGYSEEQMNLWGVPSADGAYQAPQPIAPPSSTGMPNQGLPPLRRAVSGGSGSGIA